MLCPRYDNIITRSAEAVSSFQNTDKPYRINPNQALLPPQKRTWVEMNILKGKVSTTERHGGIVLIGVEVSGTTLRAIIIGSKDDPLQHSDSQVELVFNESEVVLMRPSGDYQGSANSILCRVQTLEQGGSLCRVLLTFHETTFSALITTTAGQDMGLDVGDQVVALINPMGIFLRQPEGSNGDED